MKAILPKTRFMDVLEDTKTWGQLETLLTPSLLSHLSKFKKKRKEIDYYINIPPYLNKKLNSLEIQTILLLT